MLTEWVWKEMVYILISFWEKNDQNRPWMEYGRKRTILECKSRRSLKGWKQTIRGESRRSLVQSRRSFEPKQTIYGSKKTIHGSKQTIRGESGRSYLNFLKRESGQSWWMKADDPLQYIRMSHEVTMRHNESYWWHIVTNCDSKIVRNESRRSSSIYKSESWWIMSQIKWIMVTHRDSFWIITKHCDSFWLTVTPFSLTLMESYPNPNKG